MGSKASELDKIKALIGEGEQVASAAPKFARMTVACQIHLGGIIKELKRVLGVHRGGDEPNPHYAGLGVTDLEDLLRKKFNCSDQQAMRYQRMFESIGVKFKRLQGGERLRALIQTPITDWTDEDNHFFKDITHKVTDGVTQSVFLIELGIEKKPQGSGATGGARGGERKKLSLQEQLDLSRQMAREDWAAAEILFLKGYRSKFLLLDDASVMAQMAALEIALKARRKWLDKRDAKAVEAWMEGELKA